MKRIVYGLLVLAAMLIPTQPQELEKLKAVELIRISQEGELIRIETDTGDWGRGENITQAMENLKDTAPGTIYLDTTAFLLLQKDDPTWTRELGSYLKETVRVCLCEGEMKSEDAAEYLRVHPPEMRLLEYGKGNSVQVLTAENGRFNLK